MQQGSRTGWHLNRRALLALGVVFVLAASIVSASYAFTLFQVCLSVPTVSFRVVMTHQGFNGSVNHNDPWPVLNVPRCARVTVHLINQDAKDTHGFAISHYLDSGVQVRAGQTDDVIFNANKAGSFIIYCNILCSIHLFMQNGRLNVT